MIKNKIFRNIIFIYICYIYNKLNNQLINNFMTFTKINHVFRNKY